jgi:hypothetical protein
MRIRKGIAISIIVLLVLACIVMFAALVLRPREMKVAVLFAGYTNDSRGTRLARLRVVNEGNVTIRRERMCVLETKQRSGLYPTSRFLGRRILLDPGESEVVEIPAIMNQGAWRAAFLCFPYGLKMQVSDRMGPMHVNDPAWKMRLYRSISPTNGPIHSEWIEAHNDAAQPTAPPNDGPATPLGDSDASGADRYR